MNTATAPHPSVALAGTLAARDVTELAETYRAWRDVLAAAVGSARAAGSCLSPQLASEIREALAANGPVPATDVEDAAMALWLAAAADECDVQDATVALLREPWRVFNTTRTAGDLRLAG